MKIFRNIFLTLVFFVVCFCTLSLQAQKPVLQFGTTEKYTPFSWDELESIKFDSGHNNMIVTTKEGQAVNYDYTSGLNIIYGVTLPVIDITTDEYMTEIPNREDYKEGTFTLRGFGEYDDVQKEVSIRGRGNMSWVSYDKKPYRLKFSKKTSLCGLPSAKSYVLLASCSDSSFAQFALGIKIADMLDMPYTNHVVPVEVVFNGIYKGVYLLTNKVGINAGSVDIDEDNSVMWELDAYFDEEYKFKSPVYTLPVMLADPDGNDEMFEYWKNDFIEMEKAVRDGNAAEYIDMECLAKYMLVNDILRNGEIDHPKSVKLYKTKGGKYIFGPIWDLDFAMGATWGPFSQYDMEQYRGFIGNHSFFVKLKSNKEYIEARKECWRKLYDKFPELMDYIEEFTSIVRLGAERNYAICPYMYNFNYAVSLMKQWFKLRYDWLIANIALD